MWARAYEPELKRQPSEIRQPHSPRKPKVRHSPSPTKLAFWGKTFQVLCVIPPHRIKPWRAQYYKSFVQFHLRRAIKDKRPELDENMVILHDNAATHCADTVNSPLALGVGSVTTPPPPPALLTTIHVTTIRFPNWWSYCVRNDLQRRHCNSRSARGATDHCVRCCR